MGEEYEVEAILSAKAFKRGKKLDWKYLVKWKGYDHSANTLEPSASFAGSADEIVEEFWSRVNLNGRDRTDVTHFKTGEEVLPSGPPKRKGRANLSKDSTKAGTSGRSSATAESHSLPSGSKRKRADVSSRSRKRQQPPLPHSKSEKAVTELLDEQQPSSTIPDSEGEDLLVAADAPPVTNLPAHRQRAANPTVKRLDDSTLVLPIDGSIAAKARAFSGNVKNAPRKPGPGRTSESIAMSSTRLTGTKSGLKSVRTKRATVQPLPENAEDALEVANLLASEDSHIDSVIISAGPGAGAEKSRVEIPVTPAVPTGKQLLQLAGATGADAEELDDYDEDAEGSTVHDGEETDPVTVFDPSPSASILFPPSAPIGSATTVPSGSRWPKWSSTIFGAFNGTKRSIDDKSPMDVDVNLSKGIYEFRLPLAPSLSIPAIFTDVRQSTTLQNSTLENIGCSHVPGKLYTKNVAIKLLGTLEAGGASARVVMGMKASPREESAFTQLLDHLNRGFLFVALYGQETLAFCSSQDTTLTDMLAITGSLKNYAQTIVVSHVRIRDVSAYAEAAVEAESILW